MRTKQTCLQVAVEERVIIKRLRSLLAAKREKVDDASLFEYCYRIASNPLRAYSDSTVQVWTSLSIDGLSIHKNTKELFMTEKIPIAT